MHLTEYKSKLFTVNSFEKVVVTLSGKFDVCLFSYAANVSFNSKLSST